MRVKVPFLVLVLSLGSGLVHDSRAEKVRTNQKASLLARPGEQAKVLLKIKDGQAMTVLATEGRWLKVRVAGRTGYVPRSKVDMSDGDDDIPRNTRRRGFVDGRSRKRGGVDTAPTDRVGADAVGDTGDDGDDDDDASDDDATPTPRKAGGGGTPDGDDDDDGDDADDADDADDTDDTDDTDDADDDDADDEGGGAADTRVRARVAAKTVAFSEPDDSSDESFTARPSDVLYIESRDGAWAEVSVDDGDIGWIRTTALEIDGGGGGGARRQIAVGARIGVTFVNQSLASAGGSAAWPDTYKVGSSAATVALGASLLYRYKPRIVLGGEIAYDLAQALPGIAFDPDGVDGMLPPQTTGFTLHNLNLRGSAGYDLKRASGAMVFARLGYHREAFMVASKDDLEKNNARIPSEIIGGPMVGAAFAMPRLTAKLGLDVHLDAMLFGASVTQTKNLEMGTGGSAKRFLFGTGVTYRWKPSMDLRGSYDLSYGSVSFDGAAMTSLRGQTGTSAKRSDLYHMVTVGIGKAF